MLDLVVAKFKTLGMYIEWISTCPGIDDVLICKWFALMKKGIL